MNAKETWKSEYEKEIEHAISARAKGNEGMARVCARRAAGVIIREYLFRRGYASLSSSAYERLSMFSSLPDVDEQLKNISNHFLMKVNNDHNLPLDADLISEVQWLTNNLLLEKKD